MRHISSISITAALLIAALFASCSIDLAIGDGTGSPIYHVDSTATCSTELPMRQIIDIRTAPSRINGKAIDSSDGETGPKCSLRLETATAEEEASEVSASTTTTSWKVSGDIELPYSASEGSAVTFEWGWPEVRDFYPIVSDSHFRRILSLRLSGRIANGVLQIESIDIELSDSAVPGGSYKDKTLALVASPDIEVIYKIGDKSVGDLIFGFLPDFLPNFQSPEYMNKIELTTRNADDKTRFFIGANITIRIDSRGHFAEFDNNKNTLNLDTSSGTGSENRYDNYIGDDPIVFDKDLYKLFDYDDPNASPFSSIILNVHQAFATLYVDSIEFTFMDASAEPSS